MLLFSVLGAEYGEQGESTVDGTQEPMGESTLVGEENFPESKC